MTQQRYPMIPFADAGDIHEYLQNKGVSIDGVSFDDSTQEIVIDGDDASSYMEVITGLATTKEQNRKADAERVRAFLATSQDATNAQLNAVLRSFIRLVKDRLKPVEL
jgi:hypothetical protein